VGGRKRRCLEGYIKGITMAGSEKVSSCSFFGGNYF